LDTTFSSFVHRHFSPSSPFTDFFSTMAAIALLHFTRAMDAGDAAGGLRILTDTPALVSVPTDFVKVLQTCFTAKPIDMPGTMEVVEALLALKCDPNGVGSVAKDPCLYLACGTDLHVSQSERLVDALLKARADPDQTTPVSGLSPLMRAAVGLRPTIVKRLLQAKANPLFKLDPSHMPNPGIMARPTCIMNGMMSGVSSITKDITQHPDFATLPAAMQAEAKRMQTMVPAPLPPAVMSKRLKQTFKLLLKAGCPLPRTSAMHDGYPPLRHVRQFDSALAAYMDSCCCAVCGVAAKSRCMRCRGPRYCGTVCQRKHWPEHKRACHEQQQQQQQQHQHDPEEAAAAVRAQPAGTTADKEGKQGEALRGPQRVLHSFHRTADGGSGLDRIRALLAETSDVGGAAEED
jgi:hypothetical protein